MRIRPVCRTGWREEGTETRRPDCLFKTWLSTQDLCRGKAVERNVNHNPWPQGVQPYGARDSKLTITMSVISALKKAVQSAKGWHSFWRRQRSCDPALTSRACRQREVIKRRKRGGSQAERTAQAKAWVCRGPWRFGWNRRAKRRVMGDGSGKALVFSLLRLSRNG